MAVLGACGTNCSTKSPHKGLLPKQSNAACLLRLETPVPIRCRCRFRLSPGSARLVLAKLGLECALWHPASLFTFWTIVGAAEGHSASRIRDELRRWAVRASVSPAAAAAAEERHPQPVRKPEANSRQWQLTTVAGWLATEYTPVADRGELHRPLRHLAERRTVPLPAPALSSPPRTARAPRSPPPPPPPQGLPSHAGR